MLRYTIRAFTLIELLVVITIIIVLMSLVLAVVNTTSADVMATSARIQSISGDISSYKMTNGVYPLMNVPAAEFDVMDYDFSTNPMVDMTVISRHNQDLRGKLIAVSSEYDKGGEFFSSYNDGSNTRNCILDSWDNPLVYKPYTAYLTAPVGAPKKNSFQIWSAGPDGVYQQNSSGQLDLDNDGNIDSTDPNDLNFLFCDDITNW